MAAARTTPLLLPADLRRWSRANTSQRLTDVAFRNHDRPMWRPAMTPRLITVDPQAQGGTPVFAGTRVPVRTLFDHLEAGDPLETFLLDFPSVNREQAVAVLEEAKASLLTDAHPA
jgi:uncharacterized protein (DUF433 family)